MQTEQFRFVSVCFRMQVQSFILCTYLARSKTMANQNRLVPEELVFYLHIHNGFEGFIAHKIVISNGLFVFIRFLFDAHSLEIIHEKVDNILQPIYCHR